MVRVLPTCGSLPFEHAPAEGLSGTRHDPFVVVSVRPATTSRGVSVRPAPVVSVWPATVVSVWPATTVNEVSVRPASVVSVRPATQ